MEKHSIAIIIPTFEPTEKLPTLVHDLRFILKNPIVIVNDGSDPVLYQKIFEETASYPDVFILKLNKNTGKGEALKNAFAYCLEKNIPGIVTADSDGQHLPEDIEKCIDSLVRNPGKLVLGCRDFYKKNIPFKNKIGNRLTCLIFYLLAGKKLSDTQTGLRGIPAEFLPQFIEIPGSRFEYETNMLIRATRLDISFQEVAISTVYDSGNQSTHFRPFRDSWMICKSLLNALFLRLQK